LGHVKGKTGGPDAGTATKGNANMTTHHSTLASITKPLSGSFSNIARAATQYLEHRTQKARLANDMKLLLAMDSHMLNDIGLPDFNRLPPAQQETLLHETIWHASGT
jgi:hypothetical protein